MVIFLNRARARALLSPLLFRLRHLRGVGPCSCVRRAFYCRVRVGGGVLLTITLFFLSPQGNICANIHCATESDCRMQFTRSQVHFRLYSCRGCSSLLPAFTCMVQWTGGACTRLRLPLLCGVRSCNTSTPYCVGNV